MVVFLFKTFQKEKCAHFKIRSNDNGSKNKTEANISLYTVTLDELINVLLEMGA